MDEVATHHLTTNMAISKMYATCHLYLDRLGDCALSIENHCHAWMRGQHAHPKMVATFLTLSVVFTIGLPLLATGKVSFQEAKGVCYDRNMAKLLKLYEGEEWAFSDHASRVLFPVHFFNSLATVTSVCGFLMWLFCSPHKCEGAGGLDRTSTPPPF
jgi:hypothetical protein